MDSPARQPTSADARPLVVFIDLGTMLSFDQLAAVLRTRGVEVVHLTQATNLLARMSSRVIYHHSRSFNDTAELRDALLRLPAARVVDIQCPEFLLDEVVAAARTAGMPQGVLDALELRCRWLDKFRVAQRLADAGVPAPRVQDAAGRTADELVEAHGLPLVLKQRVGSGGEGVRIVADRPGLDAALAELGGQPLYAEQFVAGPTLCWAAAFRGPQVLEQAVYRTLQNRRAEGPSSAVEVIDDPQVEQIGRHLVELLAEPSASSSTATGLAGGLVNLDLVRGPDGPMVVDVNLRAWHSVVALSRVGLDFADAYLASLGLPHHTPTHQQPRTTGPVNVFPDQSDSELLQSRRRGTVRFLRDLAGQRRVLPARYVALQVLLFARRLASGGLPHGRRARPATAGEDEHPA